MTTKTKKATPLNPKTFTSKFGLLDVTKGRQGLHKYFKDERKPARKGQVGDRPVNPPVKVLIEAEVVDSWGNDDGVSREFQLDIKKITRVIEKKKKAAKK